MFQYVKGTCIDSTIEESLNLLSYLYAVFSFPKLYEHVLHYILRLFFSHQSGGIEYQAGVVPAE